MGEVALFIVVGFMAQMIDGCLGMAYGVFLSTILTAMGIPLAHVSASVHFSEVFTTFASGLSHLKLKNVNKKLLLNLAISGACGSILGALILIVANGAKLKPFLMIYLLLLGTRILYRVWKKEKKKKKVKHLLPLGFVGGFFDALSGGGWGPIVTSTLIAKGKSPKTTIGSVSGAKFFVASTQSVVFFLLLGFGYWKIILGLVLGGIVAAPIAAFLCKKVNTRLLMFLVGLFIIATNIYGIIQYFRI